MKRTVYKDFGILNNQLEEDTGKGKTEYTVQRFYFSVNTVGGDGIYNTIDPEEDWG